MTTFVSREAWGSQYGTGGYSIGPVNQVVSHHTPNQDAHGDYNRALELVQQIEQQHVNQGWSAIGYTWLVTDGYAFEGRGWGRSGAHSPGANSTSIGVAFLVDGRYRTPMPGEYQAVADVIREGQRLGRLSYDYQWGHRDFVATACPGDLIYANLNTIRHYVDNTTPYIPGDNEVTEAELRAALQPLYDWIPQVNHWIQAVTGPQVDAMAGLKDNGMAGPFVAMQQGQNGALATIRTQGEQILAKLDALQA